jgi:hypothetical protein
MAPITDKPNSTDEQPDHCIHNNFNERWLSGNTSAIAGWHCQSQGIPLTPNRPPISDPVKLATLELRVSWIDRNTASRKW